MTQDWAATDHYGTLEVAPDADAADLKRAYRRLAQLHHPDANPTDPLAEERFKAIALAYGILSDPTQRDLYDRLRGVGDTDTAPPGFTGVDDLVSAATAGASLGRHIITSATLPLEEAARGASVQVGLDNGSTITVKLPPGVDDGDIVRIEGKGRSDPGGHGDLIVIVHVPRHPRFDRAGLDVTTEVQVPLSDIAMGAEVDVHTLNGVVRMAVPAGTQPGARFRVEGHGIQGSDGRRGDLYVVVAPSSHDTMRRDAMRGSFAGLVDVLDQDMEVIPTVGEVFDPEIHEAVRMADGGTGPLIVTGEVRRGYRVRGKVIRPALVTVARREEGAEE
jgi:molecular chaperone DnaJ